MTAQYLLAHQSTYSMDRRGDINMDPDTRPIKAQVGTNKEAGAGALGVLPVLSKKRMTNLSKCDIG